VASYKLGAYKFSIAPALLRFQSVDKLTIHMLLDYKEAMQISEITRSRSNDPNFTNYHWTIKLHSYFGRESYIEFNAPAFSQVLTSQPILTNRQNLSMAERKGVRPEGRLDNT